MSSKRSHIITTLVGLVLAGVFLYFTFRGTDIGKIMEQLSQVTFLDLALASGLAVFMVIGRGFRWWMLLPHPRREGEVWAAQRAFAVSYGVKNVASHLGELFRIGVFKKDTGRDLGSITTTVVADRLVFDVLPLAFMMSYLILASREELAEISPHVEQVFPLFVLTIVCGIVGLLVLALKPLLIKAVLAKLGLPRIPGLWNRVDHLITDLAAGLSEIAKPLPFIKVFIFNLGIWVLAVLYYKVCVSAFHIPMDLNQLVLVFTISTIGIIMPSPGGTGSLHFFMSTALIQFLGADPEAAAASAAFAHGVNFIVLSLMAVFFFMIPRPVAPPEETPAT